MIDLLLSSEKLRTLEHALQNNQSILIEELWNAPKALIAALAQRATGKHVLILTGASQEEVRLFHDFTAFTDRPVIDFPAWETLPSEQVAPSPDIVGDRYTVLKDIASKEDPHIILTGLQACLQRLILPKTFNHLYLHLKLEQTISFEGLIQKLQEMGYRRLPVVSDKGEFAVRGGIIDVFPVSKPDPYRIEFWGDEISSIRTFDPVGQKSVLQMKELDIPPAEEMSLLKDLSQTCTILDYLGPNTVVIFDDLLALEDRYATLSSMGSGTSPFFTTMDQFLDQMKDLQKIYWSHQPVEELSEVRLVDKLKGSYYSDSAPMYQLSFQMFNRDITAQRWQHPFVSISNFLLPEVTENRNISGEEILQALGRLPHQDFRLHLLCPTELDQASFKQKIAHAQVTLPRDTSYHLSYLSSGLVLPDLNLMLLPMSEITQRYKIRRQKQRSTYHNVQTQPFELVPGEMVVHLNHGIGRFLGIEKRPDHNGILTEFFTLEYAEGSKLYVPMQQAHLLSKYIGSTEEEPRMHTLGSSRWKKTKEQTEQAILTYAKDLVQLYAKRSMQMGFSYAEDSAALKVFEENFAYVETEDQLTAIADIKKDMISPQSMDRLVCGDVGYGKTEVAMRAAFKAVVDGQKQVAVLVPTTVLAMQHYETFVDRMSAFPVRVGVLSRFRSAKEIRETLKGIEEGRIDIVIGTHRIISDDVKFKDLGLIIIDEEQRFGVKAKEHLKKIKLNVDCLTLSATPIPRTLYMSLIGARDMSVINTPPQDRVPITTVISEPNEIILKNALLRELARDGQVFVIHNRVETIYESADRIKRLLPHARVIVGHGQMSADELDQVFHAFKYGQADVLVATTIVENGIDIPNANTILIEQADRFGMADLYQLRGRVGRWNRRAYAYFLVKNLHRMPDLSRRRLNALAESSGYGGGMKVAMHDLELRGAGNILGLEQSGHVAAIGFHLYCKILKRIVKSFQGEVPTNMSDVKMEFLIDARLPESYVNEVSLRMEFYQRLGEAFSWEEVEDIWQEIQDRFGPPPEVAQWLYHFTRIRVYASLNGYTHLKFDKLTLTTEQKRADQLAIRKVTIGKVESPQDFEVRILKALS